mgnify:CR=1 FL=1
MNLQSMLKYNLGTADMVWKSYVSDLSDEDLMVRPVPGANHTKWQLGHLIASEAVFNSLASPSRAVALPSGFADRYSSKTAGSDDPADFDSKETLLALADEQRAVTLAVIEHLDEVPLDQPSPESMREYCPTVGDALVLIAGHWLMHAGQWAVTRRKLGRAPLF